MSIVEEGERDTCNSYLGIGLITIGNSVFRLHQLFGLFDHLSSKTSHTLDEEKGNTDVSSCLEMYRTLADFILQQL